MNYRNILFSTLALALAAPSAHASDGLAEINQACAEAGCFAGDAPGLPVTIQTGGSYRLTGAIVASKGSAIEITASDVRLDLAGFTIACRPDRSAPELPLDYGGETEPGTPEPGRGACENDADGISGSGDNISVRNGTIRAFGGSGVDLDGRGAKIVDLTSRGNGERGIDLQFHDHAVVRESKALDNGESGIIVGNGGLIADCVAGNNGGVGLLVSMGGMIRDSASRGNHNGAATGRHSLIYRVVSTDNNYGISPGLQGAHGVNVAAGNAISDMSIPQDRVACEAIGEAVVCP